MAADLAEVDLVTDREALVEGGIIFDEDEILDEANEDLHRCMMQSATTVENSARFPLDRQEVSQFYAVIVFDKIQIQLRVLVREQVAEDREDQANSLIRLMQNLIASYGFYKN